MNRKPDPKSKANILVTELALLGFELKRGHALDLVAKLEGHKGWNQLLADSSPSAERRSVKPAVPYLVGDLASIAVNGEVSDVRLAAYLGHGHRGQTTDLLSWTAEDGEVFCLRLCGQYREERMRDSGKVLFIRSNDGLTKAYEDGVASRTSEDVSDILETPFFEWITDDGEAVGPVFDSISVDASKEIAALKAML